ncbi:MAG: CDP-paratose 2-epimerase [candidate division Zixibacteria bacterium HGW-Zixibacteria-1]|nr:MAG: CDP-paratose 2-epimerase [candidate division Zixibacteria bacterium HGW-Zixibacteria-1]
MKVFNLEREQFIDCPLRDVFAFFERPENLSKITPPSLGFKILTPGPIRMKQGALIDYTIRLLRIQLHWRTLISSYEPPHLFIDEQLKGPYALWHHTHRFAEKDGGTLITDKVRYALPFGFLGHLMHRFIVKGQLDRIFDYRASVIKKMFEKNISGQMNHPADISGKAG